MEQRGLTQLELASRAGIDKDTVTNIMRGDSSSTTTLEKLAQALGVDVSELVLTEEQSRVLAEARVRGEDLASRISKELGVWLPTIVSSPASAPAAQPTPYAPGQERRSGRGRRQMERRSGRDRRIH
jgi:transcriptional regulator with XRE-family HTH domain